MTHADLFNHHLELGISCDFYQNFIRLGVFVVWYTSITCFAHEVDNIVIVKKIHTKSWYKYIGSTSGSRKTGGGGDIYNNVVELTFGHSRHQ